MFSALASLLVVFVILKLVAAAVSRFFAWLGSGRMLEEAVDDPNEQYAQAIRTYVDQLRRWKREHTGIGAVAYHDHCSANGAAYSTGGMRVNDSYHGITITRGGKYIRK